jgi:hypothetical protein
MASCSLHLSCIPSVSTRFRFSVFTVLLLLSLWARAALYYWGRGWHSRSLILPCLCYSPCSSYLTPVVQGMLSFLCLVLYYHVARIELDSWISPSRYLRSTAAADTPCHLHPISGIGTLTIFGTTITPPGSPPSLMASVFGPSLPFCLL